MLIFWCTSLVLVLAFVSSLTLGLFIFFSRVSVSIAFFLFLCRRVRFLSAAAFGKGFTISGEMRDGVPAEGRMGKAMGRSCSVGETELITTL